jgi:hypothetical protein
VRGSPSTLLGLGLLPVRVVRPPLTKVIPWPPWARSETVISFVDRVTGGRGSGTGRDRPGDDGGAARGEGNEPAKVGSSVSFEARQRVAVLARQQLRARRQNGLLPWEVEHRRRKRLGALSVAGKALRVGVWWFAWIWCVSNAWEAGWGEVAWQVLGWRFG